MGLTIFLSFLPTVPWVVGSTITTGLCIHVGVSEKKGVPYFGVLVIRILLIRVLYGVPSPLFPSSTLLPFLFGGLLYYSQILGKRVPLLLGVPSRRAEYTFLRVLRVLRV